MDENLLLDISATPCTAHSIDNMRTEPATFSDTDRHDSPNPHARPAVRSRLRQRR